MTCLAPTRQRITTGALLPLLLVGAGCVTSGPAPGPSATGPAPTRQAAASSREPMQRIQHLVVIYAENHSFDNLYGLFPGADGIANATAEQRTQLDHDGKPLPELVVFGGDGKPAAHFPRLPGL